MLILKDITTFVLAQAEKQSPLCFYIGDDFKIAENNKTNVFNLSKWYKNQKQIINSLFQLVIHLSIVVLFITNWNNKHLFSEDGCLIVVLLMLSNALKD